MSPTIKAVRGIQLLQLPCPSFPCFFGKRPGKRSKKQGFFVPTELKTPLSPERGAGEEFLKSAAGVPGPVPGTKGVPGRVLEAVPLSFSAQGTALLPALFRHFTCSRHWSRQSAQHFSEIPLRHPFWGQRRLNAEPLKSLDKEGKIAQKNKEILAGEKHKEVQKNKEKKDRVKPFLTIKRASVPVTGGGGPFPLRGESVPLTGLF